MLALFIKWALGEAQFQSTCHHVQSSEFNSNTKVKQIRSHKPIILTFRKLRQEDCKMQVILR